MKTITICVLGMMSCLLLACNASIKSSSPGEILPPSPKTEDKAYSETALAGVMYGKEWVSKVAVAQKDLNNPNSVIIEIYSEDLKNPCDIMFVNSPVVSLVIDKLTPNTEYQYFGRVGDTGNPATFFKYSHEQIIATETKAKIRTVLNDGFELLLYANGVGLDLQNSYINGRIWVKDCRI